MEPRPTPRIRDDPDAERFEVEVDGHLAHLTYTRIGDRLFLLHTEVPGELGGRGLGGALVRAALERARREGAPVVAFCPFARAYLHRHPEYAALVAPTDEPALPRPAAQGRGAAPPEAPGTPGPRPG